MEHEVSLGQHRQQRMMAGSAVFAWVVSFQRTFLLSITLKDGRVEIETVAPIALRATEAEALVTGRALTDEIIEQAARKAIEVSRPISDQRASAEYRREMVGALTRRALQQLAA